MRINYQNLFQICVFLNIAILTIYQQIPKLFYFFSLALLVLALISYIGFILDVKLDKKNYNRINLSLIILFGSLINLTAFLLFLLKTYFKINITNNNIDVFLLSTLIISATFIIYGKRFKDKLMFNYVKKSILFDVFPHKLFSKKTDTIEITIVNNSFKNIDLLLRLSPETLIIEGKKELINDNSPYLIKINKKSYIKQSFHIKEFKEFNLKIFYLGKLLVSKKVTIF